MLGHGRPQTTRILESETVTPEELALHLTAERKAKGFTQQQVANTLACHISQVQAFEYRPKTNRKLQTYIEYATAIGVKLSFTTTPIED